MVTKPKLPFLDPPRGFFSSLRYLGPGLILSAAIVGSGELIATTTLGAKAGFAVLWVMPVFWCLSYIAVQKPIALVIVLGLSNSVFLLVIAYQALVFRYRNTDPALKPSIGFDAFLWLSVLAIGFMGARVAWLTYLDATQG